MKKIISCMLLLLILMMYVSCNDDLYTHFELETPPDTMGLTALNDTIVLHEDLNDEVALTFQWDKAADRGAGTAITYYFKLDIANKSFETSIPKREVSPEELSISFTHKELNDLIIACWKLHPGGTVDLEAEIIADVTTYPQFLKPEISKTTINVTSYAPKPRDLFILGTAVKNEDPQKAVKMSTLTINKEYTWTGEMHAGNLKFIEQLGELLPSYNKGKDNNSLLYRTAETDPDELFAIDKTGTYAVYVNIEELEVTYTPVPFTEVYMVGNATPAEWTIENAILMQWDYVKGAYVYEGPLKEGEMKFPLKKDWSADTLMPPVSGTKPGQDDTVELVPGGHPDSKWFIPEAGEYRITLDVNKMKIKFDKL